MSHLSASKFPMLVELKDLDAPDGRPGCGLDEKGDLCKRCRGKGWLFLFDSVLEQGVAPRNATRWVCPDCFLEDAQ